jgi:hypothetical protein
MLRRGRMPSPTCRSNRETLRTHLTGPSKSSSLWYVFIPCRHICFQSLILCRPGSSRLFGEIPARLRAIAITTLFPTFSNSSNRTCEVAPSATKVRLAERCYVITLPPRLQMLRLRHTLDDSVIIPRPRAPGRRLPQRCARKVRLPDCEAGRKSCQRDRRH